MVPLKVVKIMWGLVVFGRARKDHNFCPCSANLRCPSKWQVPGPTCSILSVKPQYREPAVSEAFCVTVIRLFPHHSEQKHETLRSSDWVTLLRAPFIVPTTIS